MDASETMHRLRAGPAEPGTPGMSSILDQRITNAWIDIFILCLDNPSSHPAVRLHRPKHPFWECLSPLLTHWRRPGQTPPFVLLVTSLPCPFILMFFSLDIDFTEKVFFLFTLSLISGIDIMVFPLFLTLYSKHSVWDISFWPMNKSLVRVLDSNPNVWEESSVLKSVPRCWGHLFKVVLKWLASLYQSGRQRTHQTSIHEAEQHSEISWWALCKSQAATLLFIILVTTIITDAFPHDTHKDKKIRYLGNMCTLL